MRLHRLNLIFGVLLGLIGLYFAAAGPAATAAFGVPGLPDISGEVASPEWRLVGFVRMFGVVLLAAGLILWAVGDGVRREAARRFASLAALGSSVAFLVALSQQMALWNTAAGLGLVVLPGAMALAYGWAAVRASREPAATGAAARPEEMLQV